MDSIFALTTSSLMDLVGKELEYTLPLLLHVMLPIPAKFGRRSAPPLVGQPLNMDLEHPASSC